MFRYYYYYLTQEFSTTLSQWKTVNNQNPDRLTRVFNPFGKHIYVLLNAKVLLIGLKYTPIASSMLLQATNRIFSTLNSGSQILEYAVPLIVLTA